MSKFCFQVRVLEMEEHDDDESSSCSKVLLAADVFWSEQAHTEISFCICPQVAAVPDRNNNAQGWMLL